MRLITDLSSDNLKGLVFSLAIPSMLSQLVSVLYSIVDRMYIGNIAQIGNLALAGVGVCGPIVTMVSSFAFLVGIGSSPLLSKTLGEKNFDHAKKIVANAFLMIIVISLSVTLSAFILKDKMLWSFGASEAIYPYANEYISIYFIGTIFSIVSTAMNQIVICQGFGKQGMFCVLFGAITNIILDPIFIFGFNMGVKGAAVATVISQMVSCAYVLYFLFSNEVLVKISFGNYSLRVMFDIVKMGVTYFLIIIFDNFMLIGLNAVLQKYGGIEMGDTLLTCNTILQSFMLMVTMPLGGITTGTQTILGYNYGAKRYDKIVSAQKIIFKLAIGFCTVMFILAMFSSRYFAIIFTKTPEYIKLSEMIIRLSTIAIIPLAIQYTIVDGFTGLGKVKLSLSLSAFRKIVYFISIFILPIYIPIEYVFIAEAISDTIPVIISIILHKTGMNKLKNELNYL